MADFDYESEVVGKRMMAASPHSAGEVHVSAGRVAIDASYAASDMIGMCMLPKGCVPIDFKLKSEAIDGANSIAAAITMSIGIAKAAKSDLAASTTFIADSVIPRAGGIDEPDAGDLVLQGIKAKNVDRVIAGKVTAGATSTSSVSGAAAGEVMGELLYRAVESGEWSSTPSTVA